MVIDSVFEEIMAAHEHWVPYEQGWYRVNPEGTLSVICYYSTPFLPKGFVLDETRWAAFLTENNPITILNRYGVRSHAEIPIVQIRK